MKRTLKVVESSPTPQKKAKGKQSPKVQREEEMEKKPPDDPTMDTGDSEINRYNCETSNRFDILPVVIPEPTILCAPKKPNMKPQKIFLNKNRPEVLSLLVDQKNYVLENVYGGTNIIPSTYEQQKALMKLLDDKKEEYRSRPSPGEKLKRFVLYGLNSDNYELIEGDLIKYGIKAEKIVQIKVKNPRYFDHCNYIVYVKPDSRLTLSTMQQAKYICHTQVRWANYIVNGDGVTKCSNCQQFGHPADYCKLKSRCGICAAFHRTADCELLLERRAKNLKSIDANLLKCVHCDQKHTSGYKLCTERVNFLSKREHFANKSPTKYVNAANPKHNAWTPIINRATTEHTNINKTSFNRRAGQAADQYFPSLGQQNKRSPERDSRRSDAADQDNSNEKFSGKQIAEMFHKILDIVDNCTTKQDQMRVMIDVITQYIG